MAQKKASKKEIKVRDLKPRKDAKGGVHVQSPNQQKGGGNPQAGGLFSSRR
jgi:hypothetical protein